MLTEFLDNCLELKTFCLLLDISATKRNPHEKNDKSCTLQCFGNLIWLQLWRTVKVTGKWCMPMLSDSSHFYLSYDLCSFVNIDTYSVFSQKWMVVNWIKLEICDNACNNMQIMDANYLHNKSAIEAEL